MEGRLLFPVSVWGFCLAGPRSRSPSDSQRSCHGATSLLQDLSLVSGDRFGSPHSIFLSPCLLLCLGDVLPDPCPMAALCRMGTCCAGPSHSFLQLLMELGAGIPVLIPLPQPAKLSQAVLALL